MTHEILLVVLACIVGLWMTWGIGANDLANIMSTAMGSRAISVRQALLIAIFFEVAGAFLGGREVSDTIRGGVIDVNGLANAKPLLIYGLLSVLIASSIWITGASMLGMPVSITNSIVGALVGVGAIMLGLNAIHWHTVGFIAISWISSPIIAGVVAFILFISIRRFILAVDYPLKAAKYLAPFYLFLLSMVLALMTSLKALNHFHVNITLFQKTIVVFLTVLVVMIIGLLAFHRIDKHAAINRHEEFIDIESKFSVLMALTACAMVFAHGSNDVAIAVGPVAGVISLVKTGNTMHDGLLFSTIMFAGCIGVVLGLFMYGRKVIETVGNSITILTPSSAFAATLAAASTVVVSTSTGIPVSATQTLVGAVFGVGLARGIDALNLNVIRNIILSWIITVPVSATLATLFFYLLQHIFI